MSGPDLRAPAALFGRSSREASTAAASSGASTSSSPSRAHPLSRGAQGKDDLRHERRGAALSACHTRERPTRRRGLLRRERHALEAERGRTHGYLRRLGLDGALIRPRHDFGADDGLVRDPLRLGPPSARRSRPGEVRGPASHSSTRPASRSCEARITEALAFDGDFGLPGSSSSAPDYPRRVTYAPADDRYDCRTAAAAAAG